MLEVCHACVAAQKVLGWPRAGATAAAPAVPSSKASSKILADKPGSEQ
jgi:hypothetical protein